MMSFYDKTFCTARECSKFNKCSHALTDELRGRAQAWWGGLNPPIACFENPKELNCYSPHHENQETETNP